MTVYVAPCGSLCFDGSSRWRAARLRENYPSAEPMLAVETELDANFLIALVGRPVGDRCVVRRPGLKGLLERAYRRMLRARITLENRKQHLRRSDEKGNIR